jgi:hypothetical protein
MTRNFNYILDTFLAVIEAINDDRLVNSFHKLKMRAKRLENKKFPCRARQRAFQFPLQMTKGGTAECEPLARGSAG